MCVCVCVCFLLSGGIRQYPSDEGANPRVSYKQIYSVNCSFIPLAVFGIDSCLCTPNWTLSLDYIYYTIRIMRNFTRDVELRLLLAMTHTEYQVCSLRYIHFFIYFFFFIFGLRFFMIVCLCNCRSLRQSCFVTLIPTRGRVS